MSDDSYDTGYDHGYWQTPGHVVGAGIGLAFLDIVAVAMRFAARKSQRQPLKADDWLLIPATLITLGIGIAMTYGVSKQALAYPYVIPPDAPEDILAAASEQISIEGGIQWAYTLMLPLALGCTKASFLFFYRRIFAVDRMGKTSMFLIGMIVLIGLWSVGFFLTFLFMCRLDFWALWTTARAIIDHCISDTNPNFSLAISDVITDVIILIIPIPLIWRLNLTLAKKIAVTAVFLFGLITVAASLTRTVLTAQILTVGYTDDVDPILLVTSFIYWGMVESGVAIFVACLPTLWIYSKGSSWTPLVKVARSIASSSISSLRLLTTRRSKESIRIDNSFDTEYIRKRSVSTPSDSRSVNIQRVQSNNINTAQETYPLRNVKVAQA
ncbi:hypothetical protein F4821DRAFT_182915 [Hypoxylon rubiginosum]|uniref:Uncharacterized protein n=1 Tax=Hypoxylon rubiginosum TaxID=110542 RepID=A0ACC0CTV4_9PEZI|nr:hypothetical protein F4821DRAFT_182915 [Hypoxylon rubiginosum]